MEKEMIVKFEIYLSKMKQKQLRIRQNGFMMNQFFVEKLMYKIQDDILSLKDEDKDVYLSLNLNQVYQVEIGEKQIILFLDNDTEIQEIEKILQNACKCKNVSISEVVSAVKNGAYTFEKVAETTGAGTACGRCKEIILNIIENKR